MSWRKLAEPFHTLEGQIIETLRAGYTYGYPKSYSDMQGCVRSLLRKFEVKRRPLAVDLDYEGQTNPPGESDPKEKIC